MNHHPETLEYEQAEVLPAALPIPLWMKIPIAVVSFFLLATFVIGLPPLAGAIDYTKDFRLTQVLEYGWKQGIRGTLDSYSMVYYALFVPAALWCLVMFFVARQAWLQRLTLICNILLPLAWFLYLLPIFMVIGPFTVIEAVFGKMDGETWSEGFVCFSAMGSWSTLWLAVALTMLVRRQYCVAKSTETE